LFNLTGPTFFNAACYKCHPVKQDAYDRSRDFPAQVDSAGASSDSTNLEPKARVGRLKWALP